MHHPKKWLLASVPALVGSFLLSPPWGMPSAVSAGDPEQSQAQAPAEAPRKGEDRHGRGEGDVRPTKKTPDARYEPTSQHIVDKMLELAEVKKGDVLYDLGCGDGRIVVTAAKRYGVKAIGIDIDPQRVRESNENVQKQGVSELVTIKQEDLFEVDLREASVVMLYLTSSVNDRLMPRLAKLKPGTRIVSHLHAMRGAKPKKVITMEDRPGMDHEIYLWVVPWEKE
jgi:precorrin-6B methylase 2